MSLLVGYWRSSRAGLALVAILFAGNWGVQASTLEVFERSFVRVTQSGAMHKGDCWIRGKVRLVGEGATDKDYAMVEVSVGVAIILTEGQLAVHEELPNAKLKKRSFDKRAPRRTVADRPYVIWVRAPGRVDAFAMTDACPSEVEVFLAKSP